MEVFGCFSARSPNLYCLPGTRVAKSPPFFRPACSGLCNNLIFSRGNIYQKPAGKKPA